MPLRLPKEAPERLTKLWPLTPSSLGPTISGGGEAASAYTMVLRDGPEKLLTARLECHGLQGHCVELVLSKLAPLGQTLLCWTRGLLINATASGGGSALALVRPAGVRERDLPNAQTESEEATGTVAVGGGTIP